MNFAMRFFLRGTGKWIWVHLLMVLSMAAPDALNGHPGHGEVESHRHLLGEWLFWPEYTLEGSGSHYPGPRFAYPTTEFKMIDATSRPLLWFGKKPTERVTRLLRGQPLPEGPFSVEVWLVDHVNRPVGGFVTLRGQKETDSPVWLLGYQDGDGYFSVKQEAQEERTTIVAKQGQGWKKYWRHFVGTWDGSKQRLYLNGELVGQSDGTGSLAIPTNAELEVAAYLEEEPYMDLGNLIREVRLHDRSLDPNEVQERFRELQFKVEEGIVFSGLFHFNAGPYLNHVTREQVSIVWETERPSHGKVRFGKQVPLADEKLIETQARIHRATLQGLEPETSYFYEIIAVDEEGAEISSGLLTFKTAVFPDSAFSFAVLGDTESRPHINDRLAKAIWGERPNFLLHVGDLTDGGQRHHKFEWNLEYFLGMNQLISRVPMFPVPGNGESDLHWFSRYHRLPLPGSHYSFRFGNAEFFMLDSNRPMEPGSEQYSWLDAALESSNAIWKFAAHHHPTYTSDENDYGDTWKGESEWGDEKVRSLVPLYEKHGVDVVFFGHLHTYERSWPVRDGRIREQGGVRYVQSGGGGGNLEDFSPNRNWFSQKLYRGHHYCLLNVFGKQLEFKMYDVEGRLRDFFEIQK